MISSHTAILSVIHFNDLLGQMFYFAYGFTGGRGNIFVFGHRPSILETTWF
jgi:hypothetical protein